MYRYFLSWRYMRARRTNIIGIIGIGVGVGALILILSIMTGFLEETKKTLRGGIADIVIDARGLPVGQGPKAMLEAVRRDPRVAGACAQIDWFGILTLSGIGAERSSEILSSSQSGRLSGVMVVGIDPADEFQTTDLRAALERDTKSPWNHVANVDRPFDPPPKYKPSGRKLASCLVGAQMAAEWGLRRGSEIWLSTAVPDPVTGEMHPNDRRYVVAGTFRSGENEMDLGRVYLERAELADFLSSGREFTQVLVKLKDYEKDGVAVRDELASNLERAGLIPSSMDVHTWEDYRRAILGAIKNERSLMAIMLSLVVVVAGFTVFAILSMMVTEKRRDIGILSALGATPGGVMWLFVLIGFWDAVIGGLAGAILGTWLAIEIDSIERWLSKTFEIEIFDRSVYMFDHIPAVVNPLWVGVIVFGAFVITLVFAFFPAFKAGRLHPLDALRYE